MTAAAIVAYPPGQRVRVRLDDPPGHTRAPQYVRGRVGEVIDTHGEHPLPDEAVHTTATTPQPVYAVRFAARDLFGAGDHSVTVNLWHGYLEPFRKVR